MKNGNTPASPCTRMEKPNIEVCYSGTTKREAFAMAALQGLAGRSGNNSYFGYWDEVAIEAVTAADALLEALDD